MKKLYSLLIGSIITVSAAAQMQIDNGDFEQWENVGSTTEEPNGWNSNKTGTTIAASGPQTLFRESLDVHGGSYAARIETGDFFGTIVNGVMTIGKVNAPSFSPADGFNQTETADPSFNHPFTSKPDSIVFWVKYESGDGSDRAQINAFLHGDYDQGGPFANDPGCQCSDSVYAQAIYDFGSTNGWERIALAFDYASFTPSGDPSYLWITFTSSYTPGSGSAQSVLRVDDIEMIYIGSGSSIQEYDALEIDRVVYNHGELNIMTNDMIRDAQVEVFDMSGRSVYSSSGLTLGAGSNVFYPTMTNGVYIVRVLSGNKLYTSRIFAN